MKMNDVNFFAFRSSAVEWNSDGDNCMCRILVTVITYVSVDIIVFVYNILFLRFVIYRREHVVEFCGRFKKGNGSSTSGTNFEPLRQKGFYT